jgi:hypothetical protein
MKYTTAIILAVGAFLIIGYLIYTAPHTSTTPQPTATTTTTNSAISPPARTPPAGTKEYQNTTYHFSLFYPQELTVATFDEGGGATTITFQNVETAQGFQIFIVPYSESQVNEKRFKQDEPSGVRESLTNITVDGATAAAFYSTNAALGATREVWVVHGGFLYEMTTLKSLDTWLGSIIQTWKFTL